MYICVEEVVLFCTTSLVQASNNNSNVCPQLIFLRSQKSQFRSPALIALFVQICTNSAEAFDADRSHCFFFFFFYDDASADS